MDDISKRDPGTMSAVDLGNILTAESIVSLDIPAEKIISIVSGVEADFIEPERPTTASPGHNEK